MANSLEIEMDKGTFLGRVTLEIWDNALPDVDFKPEKEMIDFFTWKHITIMKSGITKAMKSYITEELRKDKEKERCAKHGPLPEPTPSPPLSEVKEALKVEEEVVEEPKLSSMEKRNKVRVEEAEKVKAEEKAERSELLRRNLLEAKTKPDKDVDGDAAPDLAKIRAARGHVPEGLDDVSPSAMRDSAHTKLKKQDGQAEAYVEPVVNDKDNVALGIDLPSQTKKVSKYANSPA